MWPTFWTYSTGRLTPFGGSLLQEDAVFREASSRAIQEDAVFREASSRALYEDAVFREASCRTQSLEALSLSGTTSLQDTRYC